MSYKAWKPTAVYNGKDSAWFNGHGWEAQWWSQNNQPGLPESTMWKDLGPATELPPDTNDLLDALLGPANIGTVLTLTPDLLAALWGPTLPSANAATAPAAAAAALQALLPEPTYLSLFPNHHGSPAHLAKNNLPPLPTNQPGYYSYENLKWAVYGMGDFAVVYQNNTDGTSRAVRMVKSTGACSLIRCDPTFARSATTSTIIVDYGDLLAHPDKAIALRNLVGLLANAAHETTAGSAAAAGGAFAWGLYFNEEQGAEKWPETQYVDTSRYPSVPGKRYHGRGPIQISWNYNYAQASSVIYGNAEKLLVDPDVITREGIAAFMTAIWFWMTPQSPKPSCHQVLTSTFIPTAADLAANRTPCFATTINVINGGLEAGIPGDPNVADRKGFYETICKAVGLQPDEADCCGQKSW